MGSWYDEVTEVLRHRYATNGWTRQLFLNDLALLKRACKDKHPREVTTRDLEDVVLSISTQAGRINYVHRFHSIYRSLRETGIVEVTCRPDEGLPKLRKPRALPRPVSTEQLEHLLAHTEGEVREWYLLAAFNGLRAMEVSKVRGDWLEPGADGPLLRVTGGKGLSDLVIPAHPRTVEVIESHRTFGRLYRVNPTQVSRFANDEMRRQGIKPPLSFHSLRHWFVTSVHEQTGDLLLTAELARHGSLQSTRGYAQLKQGRKREVLDALTVGMGGSGHGAVAAR